MPRMPETESLAKKIGARKFREWEAEAGIGGNKGGVEAKDRAVIEAEGDVRGEDVGVGGEEPGDESVDKSEAVAGEDNE